MAYPPLGCLLRWTENVVRGFEGEEDVLTWFHDAKDLRHVDAVPGHDDGLALGDAAVQQAVCEEDWFHARLRLQPACLECGAKVREVTRR